MTLCTWIQLRILEFVREQLPKSEWRKVKAHLDIPCVECAQYLALEKALDDASKRRQKRKFRPDHN